jgi:hypothetical protein
MKLTSLTLTSYIGLLAFASLHAQEFQRFSFDAGGGFDTPVGNTGRELNTGWNVRGGAGVNINPYFGVMLDAGYDSFGINAATLNAVGVPGGDLHVFHATIDPVVHLNPKGRIDFYLTGGAGFFHRYQEFTQPTLAYSTGFNPFFGFFPVAYPANQILASYSVNKPGADIGAGVAFGSKWHGKFFAEARYDRIYMRNSHTDYLPVSFGFRW